MTPENNDGLPGEKIAYKWAATFGVSTVFAAVLLWIVYMLAFQGQSALSEDLSAVDTKVENVETQIASVERKSDAIIEDHKMFRDIFLGEFRKLTKATQQSCLNTAKTSKALQDCIVE